MLDSGACHWEHHSEVREMMERNIILISSNMQNTSRKEKTTWKLDEEDSI